MSLWAVLDGEEFADHMLTKAGMDTHTHKLSNEQMVTPPASSTTCPLSNHDRTIVNILPVHCYP